MLTHPSPLFAIPQEILERIALHLAVSDSTGPPAHLVALLCTCKYVRHALSSADLYAKIFRAMFDVDSPRRRLGPRAIHSRFLVSQLKTYCTALRRIRHGDIDAPDAEDVLRTAFILLMENDGKNRAQLEWANTYAFVNSFLRRRLWHDPVNGWPRDTPLHSLVLWVMWCMTDQSILTHETSDERNDLITLILPYVVMAFKYPSYFAPDNHFHLPLPEEWERSDLVSMQTAHGEYPILPPRGDSVAVVSHFDRTIRFRTPPITIAAKLIYISRREMTPVQAPSDLPVDRPAALAQGISGGLTQADVIEVNSHSSAHLVPTSDWDWKSTLTPEQRLIEEEGTWSRDLTAPSAAWDNDWERSTTCWDPWAHIELKGPAYTFGSMDGLWQGRLLIPETEGYLGFITNPHYPAHFDTDVTTSTWPLFMRLKEHHCISPQEPVPAGGPEDDVLDDGIRNAWFPPINLTTHRGRAILSYLHQGEMQRTEHETFEQGHPNSHDENTCLTCQARREFEEPMHGVESTPTPQHSDFEDDFAEVGLGRPSYDDDDYEDTYETACTGIRDIIFTGETDINHGMAWGRYTFLGRVRSWDGLIALVRLPAEPNPWGRTRWVFRGYLHYGKVFVGSWRGMTADIESIPWEGSFVASKRS